MELINCTGAIELNVDRTEIKFQLHEGREKQTLLERYLNHDSEIAYQQAFINPYTGENIESKLVGSMRDHNPAAANRENFNSLVFETDSSYDSQEDITNLTELIKRRKSEKTHQNFDKDE